MERAQGAGESPVDPYSTGPHKHVGALKGRELVWAQKSLARQIVHHIVPCCTEAEYRSRTRGYISASTSASTPCSPPAYLTKLPQQPSRSVDAATAPATTTTATTTTTTHSLPNRCARERGTTPHHSQSTSSLVARANHDGRLPILENMHLGKDGHFQ